MALDFSGTGNAASIAGTLNVNATGDGSSFDATNSTTTVTGTLNNNTGTITSTSTSLIFNSGAIYNHNIDGGLIATATWNSGSTCNIIGNSGTAPTGLGSSWRFCKFCLELFWSCRHGDNVSLAGALKTVNGDFTITSIGSGSLRLLNSGNGFTLTVGGNFSQTGGSFFILVHGGNNTSMNHERCR